ncbi:MAG: MoxR-like ATPase [Candidatus Binatota bacterium]|jgi:MoxR-like ATPase|nr:MoxR-like ATPase [Candidatus Binatota bacterium]
MRARITTLIDNIERVVKGKHEAVRLAVVALLARGHLLIEDVPGVGKTTLASALARSIGCTFQRIQFTSDLLPSDLLGVSIYDRGTQQFVFKEGPIFHQLVLADEINRTTPRTQSALLEAMNENQISLDHHTYPLPRPFMVLATQNPKEYHGTFPLPESQLDRFLMRISIGYPDSAAEREILTNRIRTEDLAPVLGADEVLETQSAVEGVRVDPAIVGYILEIAAATRRSPAVVVGASPRAAQALYRAAQALALSEGEDYVLPRQVKELAIPVLAHRLQLKGEGVSDLRREEGVIASILDEVRVPL